MKRTAFFLLVFLSSFLSPFAFSSAAPDMTVVEFPVAESVSFTLHNKSLKSIPLLIPGVMNPNLSPMSNSGVTLAVGQKILFKYKGKKHVLLVVSSELEGEVLDVAKLLKEKKAEIDGRKK